MSLASDYSSGKGGLQFTAQSPPGLGRLVRIPFYLNEDQGSAEYQVIVPGQDLQNSSNSSPIIAAGGAFTGQGPTVTLKTPEISWATLRLVGFESSINTAPNQGGANLAASATTTTTVSYQPVQLLVRDLKIGGGATLFVHEDFANASVYADTNDNFAGLRDYPLIKSPNIAEVNISLFSRSNTGQAPANTGAGSTYAGQATQIVFSLNLVCEILQDDNYGSHVPGPYARASAMVRKG